MVILEQHPLHYPGEPLGSTHCAPGTVLGTVGESGSKDLPSRMSQVNTEGGGAEAETQEPYCASVPAATPTDSLQQGH